jgi:hypothetical protein
MSIEALIHDRYKRGMLFPLVPEVRGDPIRRAMFLSEDLWEALTSPTGDFSWEQRVGVLRADLEAFVVLPVIAPKYLFLLYPAAKGVWEIRSVREDPSIRVLGLFASKDVFIATNFALREQLGGWQSREWKVVKRAALAQWRRLLSPYNPIATTDVKQVVTGAIDGKYFKDPPYR